MRFDKGVTLIELIMAIAILAVVSVPTAAMIGAQIRGTLASSDYTAAGNLARAQMEQILNASYASVATGNATVAPYALSWTVTPVPGANGAELKDITLTASRSGDLLVTLYGSIANDVTYAA